MEDKYFEVRDGGNYVRLEHKGFPYSKSDTDWDRGWINTTLYLKAGSFMGQFDADFMTGDFILFKQQLTSLYDNLKGQAHFSGLEGQLELKIEGDGLGHFEVDVLACENQLWGATLSFTLTFDQTILKQLVMQLDNFHR